MYPEQAPGNEDSVINYTLKNHNGIVDGAGQRSAHTTILLVRHTLCTCEGTREAQRLYMSCSSPQIVYAAIAHQRGWVLILNSYAYGQAV